ncbi:hypothetical protein FQN60_012836 [Etheostoma spectabile]|uniref:Ig-like domain-containing protein n=1 Tax=Etheostoma spectabile TaxID=54343 RepID=A0A5J5DC68_9PERO|nr:hypothetical protein FQN60_012836 [Etheostoma spectabile]
MKMESLEKLKKTSSFMSQPGYELCCNAQLTEAAPWDLLTYHHECQAVLREDPNLGLGSPARSKISPIPTPPCPPFPPRAKMATSGAPRLSLPILLPATSLLLSLLLTASHALCTTEVDKCYYYQASFSVSAVALPLPLFSTSPQFTKVPADQIGVSGGVVSFVCQAKGDPKPKVSWNKKGKKVNSQRIETIEFDEGAGAVLRIQPLRAPRDENIYECVAENSEAEITVNAKLSIIREDLLPPGFPNIDMGPQLKVVERTRTATMLCAASGNPDPEITWFKDFLPIYPNASNGRIKQLRSEAPLEVWREPDISPQVPVAADPRPLLALSARTD